MTKNNAIEWEKAVVAKDLPRLGAWPESPHEEDERKHAGEAMARLFAAKAALERAQGELEAAKASIPKYWLEDRPSSSCEGAHTHGDWCYNSYVRFSIPFESCKETFLSRLEAERTAYRKNSKREADWQDFLNS